MHYVKMATLKLKVSKILPTLDFLKQGKFSCWSVSMDPSHNGLEL